MNPTRPRTTRPHPPRDDPARATGRGGGRTPSPSGPEAALAARRRARDRSLLRDGLVLLVVAVGLAVLWPNRLVANEDFPLAQALVARFDAMFQEVRAGREVPTTPSELAPGIEGIRFERGGEERWVLTGEAGSDCYALWWDAEGVRRGRTVPSTLSCEPSSTLTSPRPEHFQRVGQSVRDPASPYAWAPILPDPLVLRLWFLPAIIVGGGIGLAAAVRMTIALLTGDAPSATRR
jgi:hypothetical protein